MKIRAELYGDKIAVDGNLKDLIEKKECQILLTLTQDDDRTRNQFVLNANDVRQLISRLTTILNDPEILKHGFKII